MDHDSAQPDSTIPETDPWARLADYFAGDGTPDERDAMTRWIHADTQRAEVVARLYDEWKTKSTLRRSMSSTEAWTKFLDRAGTTWPVPTGARPLPAGPRTVSTSGGLRKPRPRHTPMSLRVIAGLGLGLAVAAGLLLVMLPNRLVRHGATDMMRHYTTTVGQRATITLADGATITLAPQTTLRVPSAYGWTTRTVWLDGEAYFDVPHVSTTPFIVQTGAIRTQVLGTAFDIRRYRDDRAVQVAVVTGKVAVTVVTSPRTSVTLSAGRVGVVTDSTATAVTASNMAPFTGWVNGHLVFERTPVRDVLAAVGRWYGYEFRLSDSVLATRYLSASFDHQSSADVLDALKTVLHVTMTFDGNVVTLHPQQAATPNDKRRRSTEFLHSREVGR